MAAEEERWLQEQEKDVMAPLLIRLGNPEVLSPEEAQQLYESCLSEFRDRLEEQTNLLQRRYEMVRPGFTCDVMFHHFFDCLNWSSSPNFQDLAAVLSVLIR